MVDGTGVRTSDPHGPAELLTESAGRRAVVDGHDQVEPGGGFGQLWVDGGEPSGVDDADADTGSFEVRGGTQRGRHQRPDRHEQHLRS
jgi:hypothetical protein